MSRGSGKASSILYGEFRSQEPQVIPDLRFSSSLACAITSPLVSSLPEDLLKKFIPVDAFFFTSGEWCGSSFWIAKGAMLPELTQTHAQLSKKDFAATPDIEETLKHAASGPGRVHLRIREQRAELGYSETNPYELSIFRKRTSSNNSFERFRGHHVLPEELLAVQATAGEGYWSFTTAPKVAMCYWTRDDSDNRELVGIVHTRGCSRGGCWECR